MDQPYVVIGQRGLPVALRPSEYYVDGIAYLRTGVPVVAQLLVVFVAAQEAVPEPALEHIISKLTQAKDALHWTEADLGSMPGPQQSSPDRCR